MEETARAVLEVARTKQESDIVTLSTGVKARIKPVAAALLSQVTGFIQEPEIPTFYDEDRGRDVENPSDHNYILAVQSANQRRATAAMDAMIMFGVELIDGIPADDTWLRQLRLMEQLGSMSLEGYDLKDPLVLDFLYKKFVAVASDDLVLIGRRARLNDEDIASAADSFRSKTERTTD